MPIAFKNWELAVRLACNYPSSFDKSQNVLKQSCILGLLGGEPLNPHDGGLLKKEPSLLEGQGACIQYTVCLYAFA